MTRFLTILCSLLILCVSAPAATDFKITPTARALFDAAAYAPRDSLFKPGFAVPDVRLGAKANFGQFEARADLSYRFGKLYPADIYLQWNINDHSFLKGGYFVHQFGLQSATGASSKISMEQPIAESVFGENRMAGAMYVFHNPAIHFAGSFFAQPEIMTRHAAELGNTGVGVMARFAWHPFITPGNIFQIGTTALIQTPRYAGDTQNPVSTFSASFPTKVNNVTLLKASVDSVKSIFKLSPEILWAKGRFAAEGQFYYLHTARRNHIPAFDGIGCYVMARVLLNRNARYSYSPSIASLATPPAKSWEIVAGYSYADLNDARAGIRSGHADCASLTLNYYIHKYVTWRVNYSYSSHSDAPGFPVRHANIFQTRIQFMF